jgi:hypothetical protein
MVAVMASTSTYHLERNQTASCIKTIYTDRVAALIAWMLVVRVDDLVKDGAKRRRLRRSTILDKIINANRVPSKRSRPLSAPSLI